MPAGMPNMISPVRLHAEEILMPGQMERFYSNASSQRQTSIGSASGESIPHASPLRQSSIGSLACEDGQEKLLKRMVGLELLVQEQGCSVENLWTSLGRLQAQMEEVQRGRRRQLDSQHEEDVMLGVLAAEIENLREFKGSVEQQVAHSSLAATKDLKLEELQRVCSCLEEGQQAFADTLQRETAHIQQQVLALKHDVELTSRSRQTSVDNHRSEMTCLHRQLAELTMSAESLRSQVEVQTQLTKEDMTLMKEQLEESRQFHQARQAESETKEPSHHIQVNELRQAFDKQFSSLQKQVEHLANGATSQSCASFKLMDKARQTANSSCS